MGQVVLPTPTQNKGYSDPAQNKGYSDPAQNRVKTKDLKLFYSTQTVKERKSKAKKDTSILSKSKSSSLNTERRYKRVSSSHISGFVWRLHVSKWQHVEA